MTEQQAPAADEAERKELRTVTLRDRDGFWVGASLQPDGSLLIHGLDTRGQDAGEAGEYEYTLKVAPADLPRIRLGLRGGPADDVLDLMQANAVSIMNAGEQNWLGSLGVAAEFWSWAS